MPYVPSLDGIRGVAVIAVLLYHHGFGWARGGFLGVSLFFTLSGFLITTLLLNEQDATGSLRLRVFWGRRVRRLAPAGLFGVGLALVTLVVAVPEAQRASGVVDIRAALVQMANWRFITAEAPYVDIGTVPSPILHYWSLAIEEQFYLVFPLLALLTLRRSRRDLAIALGAVVGVSVTAQLLMAGDRVYMGTETRASELAIGCLLALAWQRRSGDVPETRRWDAVGLVGLGATAVLWVVVRQSDPVLLGGGLTLVAMVSAMVIAGAMGGSLVPQVLNLAPIRFVGVISYGLYVVHFPLFLILTPVRTGLSGTPLFLLRALVSVAVAAAFFKLVELPIREERPLLGWRPQGRPAGAVVLGALMVLGVATIPVSPRGVNDGMIEVRYGVSSVLGHLPVPARPNSTPSPNPGMSTKRGSPAFPLSEADAPSLTRTVSSRPPRLLIVGDSTANLIAMGLQAWAAQTGSPEISIVKSAGCAVLAGERARYREGFEFTPSGCDDLFTTVNVEAQRIGADAIVVFIGSAQLADWRFGGDPTWRTITESAIGKRYVLRLRSVVDGLLDLGIPVLWADTPVPAWDLDSFRNIIGAQPPGSGEPVINDRARTEALNAYTHHVLDSKNGATTMHFTDGLAGSDGLIEQQDRADGLHLSEAQVGAAADTWLFPTIVAAWTEAWQELAAPAPTEIAWPLPSEN